MDAAARKSSMSSPGTRKLVAMCQRLLGERVASVDHPGGKSRDSCRLTLRDGRSVYATRRASLERATLEARVLKRLATQGAPVPRVIAFNGAVLIQEDVGDRRVSQALAEASRTEADDVLRSGLDSLARIQEAGSASGLDGEVPRIGRGDGWYDGLLSQPEAVSRQLGIKAPTLDRESISLRLKPPRTRLIKWDARPGNAIVRPDGAVIWIDWEHCGRRNRLDDLIWFLADESTPDLPAAEEALLDDMLPRFADGLSPAEAMEYVLVFGSLHSCVRIALILEKKDGGEWWDPAYCLERDKVGVTPEGLGRLCERGARWASQNPLVQPLLPWFHEVRAAALALDG